MNRQDAVRATLSGYEAVAVQSAAETLFQAGGRKVLSHGAQQGLRQVLHEVSSRAQMMTVQALPTVGRVIASELPASTTTELVRAASKTVARVALKEVAKGAGRAAGVGLLIDGAFGATQAVGMYRRGEVSKRQAYAHVAKEAGTGALACAAGVVIASAAVAVTGGLAAPVVMGLAAGGSLVAKLGLRSVGRSSPRP